MNNFERYEQIFITTFGIDKSRLEGLEYQGIDEWDSVGHMTLVGALEDEFDVMMETDDIIDFNSFEKGMEILKKYDIDMENK